MQSGRTNTILELVIAAFLAMTSGCMTPWSAPMTRTTTPRNSAAAASTPPAVRPPIPDPSKANAQSDMTGVLDKLEQVRALDPDAEPKLLEKLRQTPPDSWPLVAEQFRATLAYHEQLEAKEHPGSDESTAEARPASSVDVRQESRRLTSTPLVPPNLDSNHERPSTRIGTLLDPHDASAESAPVFAQSTPAKTLNPTDMNPATMPVAKAPAEFAANGPTQPIRTSGQADVKQAAFQAPAEASGDTAQALAKIETGEAAARSSLPSASKGSSHISEADSSGSTDDESWQQLVRKAADDLSHRVASSPATTAEIHQHVSLRMLRLLAGDTEGALEPIPHISPAEQDYWSRQFFALATFLDHHSQPDDSAEQRRLWCIWTKLFPICAK